MLSFDIRQTSSQAARVEGSLGADDAVWEADDIRPVDGVRVVGRLSSAGSSRFYLHARLHGEVALECRRCLTDVRAAVNDEIQAVFAPQGDEDAVDPDVFIYDPAEREIDLRPALRELWLLSAPRFASCREDCRGLCPSCGKNLNAGPCDCPPAHDSRWDTLRSPGVGTDN
jgi:uncharacterized protein